MSAPSLSPVPPPPSDHPPPVPASAAQPVLAGLNPAPPPSPTNPVAPVTAPETAPETEATASAAQAKDKPVKGFAIFGRILFSLFLIPAYVIASPVLFFYYLGEGCAGASKGEIAKSLFSPLTMQIAGIMMNAKGKSYGMWPEDRDQPLMTIAKILNPTAGEPQEAPSQTQPAAAPVVPPPPTTPPPPLPAPIPMQMSHIEDKNKVAAWLSHPQTNLRQASPSERYFLSDIIAHWARKDDKDAVGQGIVKMINEKLAHMGDVSLALITKDIVDMKLPPDELAKIAAKIPKLKT